MTALSIGMRQSRDEEILLTAAGRGWTIVTYNLKDFRLLHRAWRLWSQAWEVERHHAGVLVPSQGSPAELFRQLEGFLGLDPPLSGAGYRHRAGQWLRED